MGSKVVFCSKIFTQEFRIPFLIGGILSIISTGLTPFAASLSLPFLLVLRLIQGIAYSADFSAIGVVTLRWAPLDETSIFIAVMTSFISFSTFITNSASAWFCTSSLGWRWAFYSHTIATVVIFILWMLIYKDDPTRHKRVTRDELKKLQKDKTKAELEIDHFVPYTAILKNVSVWVLWLNGFALISSLTFLMIYMPMYLHDVLKFDVVTTGMLAAIGPLIHTPTKYVSGFFSDKVKIISENKKLQICNVLATGVPGVLFVLIGLARQQWNGNLAIGLIFGIFFSMAANCGGYWKATTLISRQYAHFVLSVIQFMKSVALFTAPAKWYLFIRNERDITEWSYSFYLNGFLLILSSILFFFFCNDKPAEFTKITRDNPTGAKLLEENQEDGEGDEIEQSD